MIRALNRGEGPVPVEVLRYWRSKGIRPGFDYRDVWEEEHDTAFTAAKIMREDVLGALRTSLDEAVSRGTPYETWRRQIGAELERLGFWGEQSVTDPVTGEERVIDVPRRLATIFETNMRTARAAGQWERIQRTKRTSPFLVYLVGPSLRHREEHLAWHGLCLHADDPFWETHFPPNGYGCKCHIRQVTARERDRMLDQGVPSPTRKRNEDGTTSDERAPLRTEAPEVVLVPWENRRTGVTEMVPEGIQPGFAHRPTQRLREPPPRGSAPASPPSVPTAPPPAAPRVERPARDAARGQVELAEDAPSALREVARAMPNRRRRTFQADVRRATRRLVQTAHPDLGSFDVALGGEGRDSLSVRTLRGARAQHAFDGKISVHTPIFQLAESGLARLLAGEELTDEHRSAIRSLIHEEAHGHSPIGPYAYAGPSIVIEEATTELLARVTLQRAGIYDAQRVRTLGTYQRMIDGLLGAVSRHVPGAAGETFEQLTERVVSATVRFRNREGRIQAEPEYSRLFAEALGVQDRAAFVAELRKLR